MRVEVDGRAVFVSTGGVDHHGDAPALALVHGAGQDHSIWAYPARMLAHRGIPVLAIDLPGHGRSEGKPLDTIGQMAGWLGRLLTTASVQKAVIVGHSMGSFIAVELAASEPQRVSGLVLTGTSDRMPVHQDLLRAADGGDLLAADLITGWTHTAGDRFGGNPAPGLWSRGLTARLVERSLDGALGVGLDSVRRYDPVERAPEVRCPVTVVIGDADRMARPDGARRLAAAFSPGRIAEMSGGHGLMIDAPGALAAVIEHAYRDVT